jgi:hypothetical protein
MVSAIQEQRDSEKDIPISYRYSADDDNSNLGYHKIYYSRRRKYPRIRKGTLLTRSQWKVLVLDESAKKIIDNVVKEDDILNENIASTWEIKSRIFIC